MNKKHLTGIYSVLAMLTVWCIWNTANSGNLLNSMKSLNTAQQLVAREVANCIDRLNDFDLRRPEVSVDKIEEFVPELSE